MFCVKCGKELQEGTNFCANCGAQIGKIEFANNQTRKMVYDGELHKCPNCGELLKSFETTCARCGFELRETKGSSNVKEFYNNLSCATLENEKIQLIKTFVVPNNKEDILEFFLLASTNFDAKYYATHLDVEDVSDAWLAKIEQCYKKAELLLYREKQFEVIKKYYDEIKISIEANTKDSRRQERKERVGNFISNIFSFCVENIATIIIVISCLAVVGLLSFLLVRRWKAIYSFASINMDLLLGIIVLLVLIIALIIILINYKGKLFHNENNEKNISKIKSSYSLIFYIFFFAILLSSIWVISRYGENGGFATINDIRVGISSEEIKGQNYNEIKEMLAKKGFVNIETKENTGGIFNGNLIHKAGNIKSIVIDGKEEFGARRYFNKEVQIIIIYYK